MHTAVLYVTSQAWFYLGTTKIAHEVETERFSSRTVLHTAHAPWQGLSVVASGSAGWGGGLCTLCRATCFPCTHFSSLSSPGPCCKAVGHIL
jgi:hypothetical protein